MSELKLAGIVSSFIERIGEEEALKFFADKLGKSYSPSTISNWKNGNAADPPLAVAQAVIGEIGLALAAPEGNPFPDAKIYVIMPVYESVSYWTHKALAILRYKYKNLGELNMMGSELTLLRNLLAKRFLNETDAEWALWLDSDMAPPTGYAGESQKWGARFAPEFNQVDVIERLMSHGKTFVSATYFDRWGTGIPMFDEGRNSHRMQQMLQRGPQDRIVATDWTGAGCCLVHRSVYTDMLDKIPEIRSSDGNKPDSFYGNMKEVGEDAAFALRAKEVGHQPHVDFGCVCGHAGKMVHFNEKIR